MGCSFALREIARSILAPCTVEGCEVDLSRMRRQMRANGSREVVDRRIRQAISPGWLCGGSGPATALVHDQIVVDGAHTGAWISAATLIAFRSASDSARPQRSTMPLVTVTFSSPVRPRFLLQASEDAVADRLVRRSYIQQLACAGHGLKKIGPADDTDQLTVLQNLQPSDCVPLHQRGDFMERRVGGGRDDIPRHDIRNLAAVGFDVFGRQRVVMDQCLKPPGAAPLRACFHTVQQIAFADNASQLVALTSSTGTALICFSRNSFATCSTVAEGSTVMTGATMTSRTRIATSLVDRLIC